MAIEMIVGVTSCRCWTSMPNRVRVVPEALRNRREWAGQPIRCCTEERRRPLVQPDLRQRTVVERRKQTHRSIVPPSALPAAHRSSRDGPRSHAADAESKPAIFPSFVHETELAASAVSGFDSTGDGRYAPRRAGAEGLCARRLRRPSATANRNGRSGAAPLRPPWRLPCLLRARSRGSCPRWRPTPLQSRDCAPPAVR